MRFPTTAALITACLGVHAYLALQTETAHVTFEDAWGMTPAFLATAPGGREAVTLLTSLFIHPGFPALGATVVALVGLAPRVERRMGSVGFLAFYLASGALGGLAQVWSEPGAIVPRCGAGAALAGVALAWLVTRLSADPSTPPLAPRTPSAPSVGTAS